MEGRILLFRSTAIPWSFCSLLKICVFSFDDWPVNCRVQISVNQQWLEPAVLLNCGLSAKNACEQQLPPGVLEIDGHFLFMHSEDIRISPVTIPFQHIGDYPQKVQTASGSIRSRLTHQIGLQACHASVPEIWYSRNSQCKLTLKTRKSIRVGEVSAQKKTVLKRYWEQSLRSAPLPLPTGSCISGARNGRVHTPSYTITSLIPPLCIQPSEHSLPCAARIRPGTNNLGQVTAILGLLAPGQA